MIFENGFTPELLGKTSTLVLLQLYKDFEATLPEDTNYREAVKEELARRGIVY